MSGVVKVRANRWASANGLAVLPLRGYGQVVRHVDRGVVIKRIAFRDGKVHSAAEVEDMCASRWRR